MEELNEGMNLLSEPDAAKRCDVSRITLLRAQVKFDAFSANVTRVDYCHDWRLTNELVNEYLWGASKCFTSANEKALDR